MTQDPWSPVTAHAVKPLADLFAADPDRLARLSLSLGGIYFDWSKTPLDEPLLAAFEGLAAARGFDAARDALFAGAVVNKSEGCAATHLAERGSGDAEANQVAAAGHDRMRRLVDAIEAGAFEEVTGVLHIGIGGIGARPRPRHRRARPRRRAL